MGILEMDFERIFGVPFFHSSSQTIIARFNSALLQTVVRKYDRAQARSFQLQPVFSYLIAGPFWCVGSR